MYDFLLCTILVLSASLTVVKSSAFFLLNNRIRPLVGSTKRKLYQSIFWLHICSVAYRKFSSLLWAKFRFVAQTTNFIKFSIRQVDLTSFRFRAWTWQLTVVHLTAKNRKSWFVAALCRELQELQILYCWKPVRKIDRCYWCAEANVPQHVRFNSTQGYLNKFQLNCSLWIALGFASP